MMIIGYLAYFTWVLKNIFKGDKEGLMWFVGWSDGFFNMFVAMTTQNWPDIMLVSWQDDRNSIFIWILFMILGVFLF